ncbi:inorganic phosphate transporter [Sphingomonas sp. SORGH_AS_0879]|uniref:inorganic phosphate transporter n=1 Tax=Sphingomonas sp. SORGH_AS_0879 TaxID=3041790 RepID=UPI00278BA871|nr:inorganic phosphate transporter [Sphingomonas sp. SORGH_AS_0879]MDQ1231269.1 PiT family inorganic phosphate transporter [Sphingomonas sp. SORGH_AS_0879]
MIALTPPALPPGETDTPHRLDGNLHPAGRWVFAALLAGGLAYAGVSILTDTQQVGEQLALGAFAFLALALVIALGFEFVNGFHDTANAVATVIYTNAMPAPLAVVWSGVFNFLGVMLSSGAVAYAIVTLLPVDLVLHVGSTAGYAMIFALLFAAIGWNLATWYVGLPNSSSHALIGSILGVGFANQLLSGGPGGTSGVDWGQAQKVLAALLFSPLLGFVAAFILLLVLKRLAPDPALYREPAADRPPPRGIRALLIFTCTAVSFAHGGNDGQKGMGLIMLILIGIAPTAYALNRTVPESATPAFVQASDNAEQAFRRPARGTTISVDGARATLTQTLRDRRIAAPTTYAALATLSDDVSQRIAAYGSLGKVPAAATPNLRNDMYLVLDSATLVKKDEGARRAMSAAEVDAVGTYADRLQQGTRYIPFWVKVAVALALGLGTMVGWRRIVVTVGERIGKTHLTYGMGASAELVAASTILLAERFGLPVSTTHILSSGVAGASVANGAGLQTRTVRNMALAWVMTLPAAMTLSGLLYWGLLRMGALISG